MADHSIQSYRNSRHLDARFGNTNQRVSHCFYQTQWMAHWKRTSNSPTPLHNKHYSCFDNNSTKDCIQEEDLQVEDTKSGVIHSVSMATREQSTSGSENVCNSDLDHLGLTSQVHQSAELLKSEKGICQMDTSMMEKASDKLYLQTFPDTSRNSAKCKAVDFGNSEDIYLEENHFPMYGINQKMKSIMNPKIGPDFDHIASIFSPSHRSHRKLNSLTDFSAKGIHFEAESIMKSSSREIDRCDSIKEFQTFRGEFTAPLSQPEARRLEASTSNMKSDSCIKGKRVSSISDYVHDEYPIEASLSNKKHKLCNFSGHSRFMVSEIKDDTESAKSIRHSWSRIKCGSMQIVGNSEPGNLSFPSALKEKEIECVHRSPRNMSNCFIHNVVSLDISNNLNPVTKTYGRSEDPSNALHYLLMTNNMCLELSQAEGMDADSTKLSKAKDVALFEMFTVPRISNSHGKQLRDSQSLIKSSSTGDGDGVTGRDRHMTGARRKIVSARTNTVQIDDCPEQTSLSGVQNDQKLEGLISDQLQKDLVRINLLKSHSLSTLPVKQIVSDYALSSEKIGASNRELSTPRTESMNVDQVPIHIQRTSASNFTLVEKSKQAELYNRWLRRLRRKPSNVFVHTKQTGDGLNCSEMCSLVSKHCTSSSEIKKCPDELLLVDWTKNLQSTVECSNEPSGMEMRNWIKRWSKKTPQTLKSQTCMASSGFCESDKVKVFPNSCEGKQFPSIRAMALMGRAMNRLHTAEFQRKGSLVMWNTDDL